MKPTVLILAVSVPILYALTSDTAGNVGGTLLPGLEEYVDQGILEFDRIAEDRRALLEELAGYVQGRIDTGKPARLTFICTHNSRRSHMSQIWAQTAAAYYGIGGVETFSGGIETTAFNPRAVAALERAGFEIDNTSEGDNPVYEVRYAEGGPSMEAFSKLFSDPTNPASDFCAVMTCSDADEACPYVPGASHRVAIPYHDPKAFDGTDREAAMYDERCRQIGREMFYLFSRVGR